MPQLWVVYYLRLYGRLRGALPHPLYSSLRLTTSSLHLRGDTPIHVVTSINHFSRYELERQLFGGLRTYKKEAPFHGAQKKNRYIAIYLKNEISTLFESTVLEYIPNERIDKQNYCTNEEDKAIT